MLSFSEILWEGLDKYELQEKRKVLIREETTLKAGIKKFATEMQEAKGGFQFLVVHNTTKF